MRFFFLLGLVFFLRVESALAAEDSAIRIIREDGSVTEYSLPGETVPPVPSPAAPVKKEQKEVPLPQVRPSIPVQIRTEKKEAVVLPPVTQAQVSEIVSAPAVHREVPVPGRKPEPLRRAERVIQKPEDQPIPRSLAVSIAISHAPPARDFKVMRQVYDDIPVYEVVFATEEGAYTVMVDAASGKVVSAQ